MAKEKKNVAAVAKAEATPSYKPLLIADKDFDTLWYARSKEVKESRFAGLFETDKTPCKVYKGQKATFTAGAIRPKGNVGSESDFIRLCLIKLNVTQPNVISRNKIRIALCNAGYKASIALAERRLKTYEKQPYGNLSLNNGDSRLRAIMTGQKDIDWSILPEPCFDMK